MAKITPASLRKMPRARLLALAQRLNDTVIASIRRIAAVYGAFAQGTIHGAPVERTLALGHRGAPRLYYAIRVAFDPVVELDAADGGLESLQGASAVAWRAVYRWARRDCRFDALTELGADNPDQWVTLALEPSVAAMIARAPGSLQFRAATGSVGRAVGGLSHEVRIPEVYRLVREEISRRETRPSRSPKRQRKRRTR